MKHIDSAFDYLRFNLKYTLDRKEGYKSYLLKFDERYYGYILVRISTECQMLLDQFMEIAWQKTTNANNIDINNKAPHINFPVCYTEKDFNDRMSKRMKIGEIESDYPDLFLLIRNIQPFICEKSWLHDQYEIASQRHSKPHLVYNGQAKMGTRFSILGVAEGSEYSASISYGNITKHISVRRWGIPDRPPPKVILKSHDEAVDFIENSISGTNSLICNMIDCFEKRLPKQDI